MNDFFPLKKYLKKHKHTQLWLAEESGFTPEYINKVINGKHSTPSESFKKIIKHILYTEVQTRVKEYQLLIKELGWES